MGFLLERPDGDVREVAVRFAWYAAVSVLVLEERGGLTVSVGSPPMETTLRFLGHVCVALLGERVQLLFEREAIGAWNAQIDACLHAVMGKPRCFFD